MRYCSPSHPHKKMEPRIKQYKTAGHDITVERDVPDPESLLNRYCYVVVDGHRYGWALNEKRNNAGGWSIYFVLVDIECDNATASKLVRVDFPYLNYPWMFSDRRVIAQTISILTKYTVRNENTAERSV